MFVLLKKLHLNLVFLFVKLSVKIKKYNTFNPLNAELNPICHLLALLGGATIVVVSRLRVNACPISPIL